MKLSVLLCLSAVSLVGTLAHGSALPESRAIDAILAKSWQKQNVQPNAPAPDSVLVRRLYLDIAGRIPTAEETAAFIDSKDPLKRTKLIDTLLASDGYTSHMFNYWADVLRLTDNTRGKLTAQAYALYIKEQLKKNAPYDALVRDLLTTQGGVWDSGAIGFYQRDENKLDHLAYTTQVFLGTSIVCAQCHNHPFDKWTQMDYYGMAAFTYGMDTRGAYVNPLQMGRAGKRPSKEELAAMTKPERKAALAKYGKRRDGLPEGVTRADIQQVREAMNDVMRPLRYTQAAYQENRLPALPHDYQYTDAKPGQKIEPKVLFGHEAVAKEGETRLHAFAGWMTSPENPRFTTVIANRMWKKVFGIGLIEPVDEITDSTVPSNGELMEYLSELMVQKKYSLKSFLRVLYNTDTYQRMASTQELDLGGTYAFTGPILRRMSAEQIWDSMLTLNQGNVDSRTATEDKALETYLGDLKMLLDTVQEKGVPELVTLAKANMKQHQENRAQATALRQEIVKNGGDADETKKLAARAQKLRREASNDLVVAIVGEERAENLVKGYNPQRERLRQAQQQSGVLNRKALQALNREERQELIRATTAFSLTARASELQSPTKAGHFLRTFGQSDREVIENASDDASIPQALTLLNGPAAQVLSSPVSLLNRSLKAAKSDEERMKVLYVSFLSREPTTAEMAVLKQVIQERGEKAVQDVSHALLTGSQFLFIQ